MHPSRIELQRFIEDRQSDPTRHDQIAAHIVQCDICREFCDEYRQYIDFVTEAEKSGIPDNAQSVADKIFNSNAIASIIPLTPFEQTSSETAYHLAADGPPAKSPPLRAIATLFSEQPELVLKVMRHEPENRDTLHLISDDPSISAGVMISIPEIDLDVVTDENGEAVLDTTVPDSVAKMNWQVRLPDAVFTLEPFHYDPERTIAKKQVTFETKDNDRIEVHLEEKTEGNRIAIRVTQVGGRADYGQVRIVVGQSGRFESQLSQPDQPAVFGSLHPDQEIVIRLFR